jgi:hypothetical protein
MGLLLTRLTLWDSVRVANRQSLELHVISCDDDQLLLLGLYLAIETSLFLESHLVPQLGGALRTQVWLARTYWGCGATVIMRKSSTPRVSILRLATARLLGRRGSVW